MILPGAVKKLIAVFRGDVAPSLILLSVLLGFWFGLAPGFYGLHVGLLVVTLILNVNLGLFLIFAAAGKALCYAAAPVLYHAGLWTQDSLPGVLNLLAALPVVGVTDFSRIAVAGATALGPAAGAVLGLLLALSVQSFRRTILKLDESSEAFHRWRTKGWVRLLDRLLIGKSARDPRSALSRRPRHVRLAGVVLSAVLVAGFFGALSLVDNQALAQYGSQALTRANGAQTDIASLVLAPAAGRLAVTGLAATDPDRPTQNRLAVEKLTADVDLWNLSRGRLVMDEVELVGVRFDEPREAPGRVVTGRVELPEATFNPAAFDLSGVDVKELAEYVQKAKELKEWLAKVRRYLPEARDQAEPPADVPESYLEYLRARTRRPPVPRVLLRRLVLDPVAVPAEQIGPSRIVCQNLSDSPAGAGLPVTIELESKDRPVSISLRGRFDQPGGGVEVQATFEDVDLKELQRSLQDDNAVRFEGGRASGSISGELTRDRIDLAIRVKTRGMKASAAGAPLFGLDSQVAGEAVKVLENLETTLRLVGPLTAPRLVFDDRAMARSLRDALVSAGKTELARRADEMLAGKVPGLDKPSQLIEEPAKAVGDAVGGLLGGKKGDKGAASEEAQQKDENRGKDPLSDLTERLKKKD